MAGSLHMLAFGPLVLRRWRFARLGRVTQTRRAATPPPAAIHPAWWAAAATFLALLGAAAFRATPGRADRAAAREFGWSIGTISVAVSVNLPCSGSPRRSPPR